MTKLLPCPFCGSENIGTLANDTERYFWHTCASCGCETEGQTGKQAAAEQWNQRASPFPKAIGGDV